MPRTPPAVAALPGRRTRVPNLPVRSEAELAASLQQSAVEIGLYNDKQSTANSYKAIDAEVKQFARRHRRQFERRHGLPGDREALSLQSVSEVVPSPPRRFRSPARLRAYYRAQLSSVRYDPLAAWRQARPDLAGLPFLEGDDCRLDGKGAKVLAANSRLMAAPPVHNADAFLLRRLASRRWTANDVPALTQILQPRSVRLREYLVGALARIDHRAATVALAQRAVFDLSEDVRLKAVGALTTRSADEFRAVLLRALRYPWAPAAEHAADALVMLNDFEAVPELEKLLDAPDPSAPYPTPDGTWRARDLVRVNHMRNCYLCHAPSLSTRDTIRAPVPEPETRLPGGYYESVRTLPSVRADVTYIRQDFSATHVVPDAKPWPAEQRFDYFVRTRKLSAGEARDLLADRSSSPEFPQRAAVRYALHRLRTRTRSP